MIYLDEPNISRWEYLKAAMMVNDPSTRGVLTEKFESAMADFLGVRFAIATNSGTSALHLALLVSGVIPENTVFLPALTFVATANAVSYCGARVGLLDVDRKTWVLTEDTIQKGGKNLAVNSYGNPPRVSTMVEDAAEGLGAVNRNQEPFIKTYSFNGNKTLTTGGGGLVVTNNKRTALRIKDLSTQARLMNGTHHSVGFNYRMPGLNAALGLVQIKHLPGMVDKQRYFNSIYRAELSGIMEFQEATPGTDPSWWFTAGLFPEGTDIPRLQVELSKKGVRTRRVFRPLSDSVPYMDDPEKFPNAYTIYRRGLCLPRSLRNSVADIYRVCEIIRRTV